MTDKRIIDGIDISECVYLQDGICTVSRAYYKQLKRQRSNE